MTRFAWMQFRTQAFVALGALAAIAIALAVTGPHLAHLYHTTVANCAAQGDCTAATTVFLSKDRLLQDLGDVLIALPALAGIFWGAPLVARELETRTEYLAWTQGVTRRRWIIVKLALIGVTCVAASGLLSLMVTWWSSPSTGRSSGTRWRSFSVSAWSWAVSASGGCATVFRELGPGRSRFAVGLSRSSLPSSRPSPSAYRTDPMYSQGRAGWSLADRDQCRDAR